MQFKINNGEIMTAKKKKKANQNIIQYIFTFINVYLLSNYTFVVLYK